MKTRRTVIFSLLVFVLGLSLLMLGSPGKANAGALSPAEWESIAGYIDGYIQSQYVAGPDVLGLGDGDNEYGFIYTPALYRSTVDNNGVGGAYDGTVCGVDDDMANRPVLVDNLWQLTTLIPGTSIRNKWNDPVATNALSAANLTALRNKVIAHREAGFSDDIAVY